MNSRLSFFTVGPFHVTVGDHPLEGLSSGKMSALLVYLIVQAGYRLRREALAGLLWPEQDAEQARSNLRHAFFHLRKVLERDNAQPVLLSGRDWISFNRDCGYWLDAAELAAAAPSCTVTQPAQARCASCIEQMERQAGLYRGEFMVELSLPDCPDFEAWLQVQREALHRHVLSLLEKLSDCHEQMGNHGKALQFAVRYTELEPWNEDAHRRAMRLYAFNGQSGAAIAQFDTCCRVLKEGLGALPSEETQRLFENIRNGGLRRKTSVAPEMPPILPEIHAERRQVTVLYCELISASDDPDETMEALRAPQARCVKLIRQFSGHIVQTHGGGLLAYFGYPQADEFAARHAVQAALAVTGTATHGIEIRAGVHTGLVITGGDPAMPDTVGKTSRLAIQLRLNAAPNEVAVSRVTSDIAGGYFDFVSLGAQSLPGFAQAVEVFRAIRESGAHTRLDAAVQLTPLVGREVEMAQLLKLWKSSARGKRNVVLLQGEAGIGKSRLVHALREHLAGQQYAIKEMRCLPEFGQSPFYPLIAMLEIIFGFAYDDAPEQKSGKLAHYFEGNFPSLAQQAVPLLAKLLVLPPAADYQESALSPQQQKEQTIAVLLDLLHALAIQQPLLLILEDLHWIDPSTLELLTQFIEQKRKSPVLALLTARPEFDPPWVEAFDTTLDIKSLDNEDVAEIVASISPMIKATALRHIVERADGVPLFAEEMAKIACLDHQASIPATLHDLLAVRMDKLGEAKHIAQLAATIGREFDVGLLRKAASCGSAALAHGLGALQDAGLIFKLDETNCQFKHALIQEAAYQAQTKADRKVAHGLIAQALQRDFPDVAANQPEVLAQHFAAAGETQQAIAYWIKAGHRAVRGSANLEAAGHFDSALQLLMTLPAGQDRNKTEFTILTNLCPVLYATRGYGSGEATRANERLTELGGMEDDSQEHFLANWAQVMNTIAGVGSRDVPQAAMKLFNIAHDDPLRKQAVHYALADAAFWLGDFATCRSHTEQSLALYRPEQHALLLESYNEDLSVSCAAYLAWSLHFLGHPEQAQKICVQMLNRARKLAHPHTLGLALCFASVLHRWQWKPAETLSLSAETIAVSRQYDFSVWLAAGEMAHGWALVMHGQKEGLAGLKSGIAGMRAAIGGISVAFLSALAEAYVHLEMYDEALALITESYADTARTGDGHYTAELHRLEGTCLLALSPSNTAQAKACFDQSLAVSLQQGARSLELRAVSSLARLSLQQSRQTESSRKTHRA